MGLQLNQTSKWKDIKELDYRLIKSKKAASALKHLLRAKQLSRKSRFRLFKEIAKMVTENIEEIAEIVERKKKMDMRQDLTNMNSTKNRPYTW